MQRSGSFDRFLATVCFLLRSTTPLFRPDGLVSGSMMLKQVVPEINRPIDDFLVRNICQFWPGHQKAKRIHTAGPPVSAPLSLRMRQPKTFAHGSIFDIGQLRSAFSKCFKR